MAMINKSIMDALKPICPNVYPDVYTGKETEYIVFTYDIRPMNHGDNRPFNITYDCRVHYLCPLKKDAIQTRIAIMEALFNMDDEFVTYPSETNATDEEGQHFVYEFEVMGDMFDA